MQSHELPGMMNFDHDFGTRFQVQLQVSDGWQQSPPPAGTATLTVTRTDSELTRSTRRNLNFTQTSFKFIIMSNLNNLKGRLPAATVTRPGAHWQRGGP
jgi:hypothetical protein